MKLWLFPAIALALATVADLAPAQCRTCSPTAPPGTRITIAGRPAQPTLTAEPGWYVSTMYPGWHFWWEQGKTWAWFEPDSGKYQEVRYTAERPTGQLMPTSNPPWLAGRPGAQPVYNGGIELDKMPGSAPKRPSYLYNDGTTKHSVPISGDQAYEAVGNALTDDSGKMQLTIVSRDEQLRRAAVQEWQSDPALAHLRDKTLVQSYGDPQHYHLAGFKLAQDPEFQRTGFAAYLQGPRQGSFAQLLSDPVYEYQPGALRRVDPNYAPGPLGPLPIKLSGWGKWLAFGLGGLLCLGVPFVLLLAVAGGALLRKPAAQPVAMRESTTLEPRPMVAASLRRPAPPVRKPAPSHGLSEVELEMPTSAAVQTSAPAPARVTLDDLLQAEIEQTRRAKEEIARQVTEQAAKQNRLREFVGLPPVAAPPTPPPASN